MPQPKQIYFQTHYTPPHTTGAEKCKQWAHALKTKEAQKARKAQAIEDRIAKKEAKKAELGLGGGGKGGKGKGYGKGGKGKGGGKGGFGKGGGKGGGKGDADNGQRFEFRDAQGQKNGISAPLFAPAPDTYQNEPWPPLGGDRGDARTDANQRGDANHRDDHGMYSGDDY